MVKSNRLLSLAGLAGEVNSDVLFAKLRSALRWTLFIIVLALILFASGQLAILWPKSTAVVDTRSELRADYSAWAFTTIKPVDPGIIEEIQRDNEHNGQEGGPPVVRPGVFWPNPTPFVAFITETPTPERTASPTPGPTLTATVTGTATGTPPTGTNSPTPVVFQSPTPTATSTFASLTPSPTRTLTRSATATSTRTATTTASATPSRTATATTVIPTATRTNTPVTPSSTPTRTPTATPTGTITNTATATATATITNTSTATLTPTITNTPTVTNTPTATATATVTFTSSATATATATPTPTDTPTSTPVTPPPGATFYFHSTPIAPSIYEMQPSQPSTTDGWTSGTGTVTFTTVTISNTQILQAGMTTVSLFATNTTGTDQTIGLQLDTTLGTPLGVGNITVPPNTSTPALFMASFANATATFGPGEQLVLRVNVDPAIVAYWARDLFIDYSASRIELPPIN